MMARPMVERTKFVELIGYSGSVMIYLAIGLGLIL